MSVNAVVGLITIRRNYCIVCFIYDFLSWVLLLSAQYLGLGRIVYFKFPLHPTHTRVARGMEPENLMLRYSVFIKILSFNTFRWILWHYVLSGGRQRRALPREKSKMKISFPWVAIKLTTVVFTITPLFHLF